MGAIASGGVIVLDRAVIQGLGIPREAVEMAIAREQAPPGGRARTGGARAGGRPGAMSRGRQGAAFRVKEILAWRIQTRS